MIDVKILRQQVELGASPARIVDLVEQMLEDPCVTAPSQSAGQSDFPPTLDAAAVTSMADPRADSGSTALAGASPHHRIRQRSDRTREIDRLRSKRYRHRKRTALLSERDAGVTNGVTQRDATPPSPPVTPCQAVGIDILPSKTMTCKEEGFPDLSSRFSSCVKERDGVTQRDDVRDVENLSLFSIPCQNTLFPLVELGKEERKKERTKERKKEERDRILVVVRKEESKNLSAPARAREATAGQDKGRRTALPDDWQVSEAGLAFARQQGLTVWDAAREADRFADHARASGRLCAGARGWEAAWRNWIRSPYRVRQAPAEQPFDVRRHIV